MPGLFRPGKIAGGPEGAGLEWGSLQRESGQRIERARSAAVAAR